MSDTISGSFSYHGTKRNCHCGRPVEADIHTGRSIRHSGLEADTRRCGAPCACQAALAAFPCPKLSFAHSAANDSGQPFHDISAGRSTPPGTRAKPPWLRRGSGHSGENLSRSSLDRHQGRKPDLRCGREALAGSMQKRTSRLDTIPELERSTLREGGDIHCAHDEYTAWNHAVCPFPKSEADKADNQYWFGPPPADRAGYDS